MSSARRSERTVQVHPQGLHPVQEVPLNELIGEDSTSPHRTHGMGTGGPDTDGKKIENTNSHDKSPY